MWKGALLPAWVLHLAFSAALHCGGGRGALLQLVSIWKSELVVPYLCWPGWATVFSMVFVWSRVFPPTHQPPVEFSVLLGCPFAGPLARESRLLLGFFFGGGGLCLLAFPVGQLLQLQVQEQR